MNITINKLKKERNGHEGESVYSVIVMVDGVPFAKGMDSPYGALMQFDPINLPEGDFSAKLKEINAELGKEMISVPGLPEMPNSLHLVVAKLIGEEIAVQGVEKEYQRNMKRLGFVCNGEIFLFPAKIKPTAEAIRGMRDRPDWVPENRVIQEIPKEELLAIIRKLNNF